MILLLSFGLYQVNKPAGGGASSGTSVPDSLRLSEEVHVSLAQLFSASFSALSRRHTHESVVPLLNQAGEDQLMFSFMVHLHLQLESPSLVWQLGSVEVMADASE